MDALQALQDEVALEGLDGITIGGLWFRLEHRIPKLLLQLDCATKKFLWQALVCNSEIDFFELPQERPPLVYYDRFSEIDPETGIHEMKSERSPVEDVYPVHIVLENKDGIKGSCKFFKERVSVTHQIRTKDCKMHCSLEDASKRWGEKLVMVASQKIRHRSLIGWDGDPDLNLSDLTYCILERLGRARWQGELQRDLHCGTFKTDARKLHYLRKPLDRNNLVTLQSHVIRLPNGSQQHSVLLLLKRFHVDRRSKYALLMEKVCQILSSKEDNLSTMSHLKEELNICERTFKRLYQYLLAAGKAQIIVKPLQEIDPSATVCKTKKGTDIVVRCLKLLPEKKRTTEEDDENEDDDDKKIHQAEGRVVQRDLLTQAYELIESRGTKGASQTEIRQVMNLGKLESRMICRLLERFDKVKGFMEDEGRQRTTKYIAKCYVEHSKLNLQFAKEKARSEKLATTVSSLPTDIPTDEVLSPVPSSEEEIPVMEKSDAKPTMKKGNKNPELKIQTQFLLKNSKINKSIQNPKPVGTGASKTKKKENVKGTPVKSRASEAEGEEASEVTVVKSNDQAEKIGEDAPIIEEVCLESPCTSNKRDKVSKKSQRLRIDRPHETYRLLKRKNMIVEAVQKLKLVESLYLLQKMINDEEKQEGVATKCCKKSTLRLVQRLSQEGLLRLYRTTLVQDGINKKVELVVHPSILPNDPLVKSAIEQVRFRMSSSYNASRMKFLQNKNGPDETQDKNSIENSGDNSQVPEQNHDGSTNQPESPCNPNNSKTDEKMGVKQLKNFHPLIVPGLGRSLGFLPKMPRLKLVHIFLWYLINEHPLRKNYEDNSIALPVNEKEKDNTEDALLSKENTCSDELQENLRNIQLDQFCYETVYVDEVSWKRFVPPTPMHQEYGRGWGLVSDILLCLPLSVFVQIIQISYKVEGLEDFLNDPVKQHTLIRFLPKPMRQLLLYKRKYIFSFWECLQRLCYIGLVQLGPSEKFQDKDQIFVYMKRKVTIVDTSTCDPHYNLARSSRPFEKRFYNFTTLHDVENFWFDLQCVCLNTPLGIIRNPRQRKGNSEDLKNDPDLTQEKLSFEHILKMSDCMKGQKEVIDDGVMPGDGQGAGGLDSNFFSHLRRNWIWTSYILDKTRKPGATLEAGQTLRLQTFLTKHPLPFTNEGSKLNRLLDSTTFGTVDVTDVHIQKRSVDTRNKGTASNKKLKRKKSKNSVGKKMKKNRKERKPQKKLDRPSAFHDEADRSALQRMTRQRVAWTAQEDGLLMLCRIAIHILNKKVKGPFVPWQAVRDVIHSNLEESLDKTSMSVGRRARHIMKNPQTLLNFKICVAEVYQDKDLTEKFLKRKSNYESPEVCAAEFKEFVEELRKKFSTTDGGFHLEIPDTKEELFRQFRLCSIGGDKIKETKPDVLTSFDDIYSAVLNNLIQSTLAMSDTQMKICQSFQTFYLYRKYREDLLYQVFKECQKKGLVNRRRVNQILGPKKSRALPFAAMSYQLSQSYYRFFTWRFPNTLCAELDRFSEQLKSVGSEDKPNNFSFMDKDTVDSKTEMMLFPMDAPGGYCLFSLSLFILGFLSVDVAIPEQIVVVDSAMMDNEVTKGLLKDGMDDEEEEEEAEDIENKRKIEVKARQASHTNYLLMRGFCSPGIVNTRNLNTCDNVVVNSCQLKVKLRVTPAHHWFCWPGISKVTEQISEDCQLPENFTRILRKSKDVCRLDRFRKLCVEEYGYSAEDLQAVLEISSAIEESKSFGCDKNDLRNKFLSFKERKEGRTRSLHQYVEDLIKLEEVLEVGANTQRLVAFKYSSPWLLHIRAAPLASKRSKNSRNISRSIKRKLEAPGEEDGAPSNKKAHVPFNNPTPEETSRSQEALSAPTEVTNSVTSMGSNLVLESREENQSTSRTSPDDGVHIKDSAVLAQEGRDPGQDPESGTWEDNAGDEIDDKLEENVTDEEKESKCEEISFISRPWRIVDGSLNKPVCKGMLEAMLFHIMTKPGIPDQTLIHHYKGVIQPVVVLELLQALETLGCIQKKQIKKSRKASLFSRPEILEEEEEEEDAVQTSSASTVFYEPAVDCCLKLAKLFPHEPNWNKWVPFIHT
ncbi:TF3C1 factor, partial [Polypterus senegalus]|nr:general transcription factor 3C polypeptide 1-like [Polypterus senegalus]MBN3291836.1 TF3C1 factor [Polypterus senegalus]